MAIFDSNLPLDEQVDLLPYDEQWEFPREKLKLGKIRIFLIIHRHIIMSSLYLFRMYVNLCSALKIIYAKTVQSCVANSFVIIVVIESYRYLCIALLNM